MAKIIWTNRSLKDIRSIYDFISLDSAYYAARFIYKLVKRIDQLEEFPDLEELFLKKKIHQLES
jgi:plasmid stabilization system protein ParE